MAEQPHSY